MNVRINQSKKENFNNKKIDTRQNYSVSRALRQSQSNRSRGNDISISGRERAQSGRLAPNDQYRKIMTKENEKNLLQKKGGDFGF